jgi:hypothetical protein
MSTAGTKALPADAASATTNGVPQSEDANSAQACRMRLLPTKIAFVLCLAVATVLAVRVARTELAGSPPFGREELQAWLTSVSRDETIAVRRRAARQLDRDLHEPFDWQPTFDQLPPAEQSIFAANWQSLLVFLLEQRADAYRALPNHRRERFLDAQLLDLQTWYAVGPRGKTTGLSMFAQLLAPMSSTFPSVSLGKVSEFTSALQGRVLNRSLQRAVPGNAPPRPRDD